MPEIEPGRRVVIEGTDGTGKTTIANMLAYQLRLNEKRVIRVDEPDSAFDYRGNVLTPAASELRKIIKDGTIERSADANVVLFTAAAFANWATVTKPAIKRGDWVIQARDYTSRKAYQGHAEGYGIDKVDEITRATMGDEYMEPDFRVILDFNDDEEAERIKRISGRGALETPDTFESRSGGFQQDVKDGYRFIAEKEGIEIISANQDKYSIATQVFDRMIGKLGLDLVRFNWQQD